MSPTNTINENKILDKLDILLSRQAEISIDVATLAERVDNSLKLFDRHLEDDRKLADRISLLEISESKLTGKLTGVGIAGIIIGYLIDYGFRLLGK